MDFNFGEINEPVSRAFYDDYEDASLNLPFKRFVRNFAMSLRFNLGLIFNIALIQLL